MVSDLTWKLQDWPTIYTVQVFTPLVYEFDERVFEWLDGDTLERFDVELEPVAARRRGLRW